MSGAFKIIAVLFFLLWIGTGAALVYQAGQASVLGEGSQAFANQTIRAVAINWNIEALESRASMELSDTLKEKNMDSFLGKIQDNLGNLTDFESASGNATIHRDSDGTETIYASFESEATFEKASGQILITLVMENNEWKINNFHVQSEVFDK